MLDLLRKSSMPVSVVLLALALSACAAQQRNLTFPDGGHGLVTPYTFTLRHFTRSETMDIIDVMVNEFPGYRTHTLIRSDSATRQYSYTTSAGAHKLEEWLTILLGDMNLNPDTDVNINIEGTEITVEKRHPGLGTPRFSHRNVRSSETAPAADPPSDQPAGS